MKEFRGVFAEQDYRRRQEAHQASGRCQPRPGIFAQAKVDDDPSPNRCDVCGARLGSPKRGRR